MTYIKRIVDRELDQRLASAGAVLIEGARACGKTETGRQAAASAVYVDADSEARALTASAPDLLLAGETPRLIDEWQVAPQIWNLVRRAVDDRRQAGQFILTGSAVPADDATRHSGAGRFSRLRMRPLSLFESGHSSGAVSLRALLAGERQPATDSGVDAKQIAPLIVAGGWPECAGMDEQAARRFALDYLDHTTRVDIRQPQGAPDHDPIKVGALLRSLARNSASEASVTTLSRDAGGSDADLSRDATSRYLNALRRIFVLAEQPAWRAHLRSRATLRKSPKLHLVDPSLAAAALGADGDRLLRDLETLGLLFESLVYRDLLTYCQPLDATTFHYRDSSGLEVDAVVETPAGEWAAFEVKLNPGAVDDAAHSLRRFADRVDTARMGSPKTLGVIVAGRYGYTREDGVSVIPVGALGP